MWTIYYEFVKPLSICGHSGYFLYFTITDITVNNLINMNLHVFGCV